MIPNIENIFRERVEIVLNAMPLNVLKTMVSSFDKFNLDFILKRLAKEYPGDNRELVESITKIIKELAPKILANRTKSFSDILGKINFKDHLEKIDTETLLEIRTALELQTSSKNQEIKNRFKAQLERLSMIFDQPYDPPTDQEYQELHEKAVVQINEELAKRKKVYH